MKQFLITLFIGVIFSQCVNAQQLRLKVQPGIDTSDKATRKVINTWRGYLASNPDSVYDNPYWNEKEKEKYKIFDLLRSGYLKREIYTGYKPILLAVTPKKNHFYEIKTAFLSLHETILCIANVYAKKINGSFKLFNALPINTRNWQEQTIGSITYHFKNGYPFSRKKAEKMVDFARFLQRMYNLKPKHIDYYIGKNIDELMRLDGLETYIGMGNPFTVSGYSDVINKIIFSGGGGAYYPHEMTHIYLNPLFPDANRTFMEGLAVYYGGSLGHILRWHLKRLNGYLHKHPEINLDNFYSFEHMDNYTNPQAVIGGLLCKLAFDKGGRSELVKLLQFGKSRADFYKAIKKVFGVERNHLNEFLRNKINAAVDGDTTVTMKAK